MGRRSGHTPAQKRDAVLAVPVDLVRERFDVRVDLSFEAAASINRAPSRQISSSAELSSARVVSSATTFNLGVPSSPAFPCRHFFNVKQEGTPRPRTDRRSTTSGHNSRRNAPRFSTSPTPSIPNGSSASHQHRPRYPPSRGSINRTRRPLRHNDSRRNLPHKG
jgi:hypothetical protein